jgi:hypothetical protein
MTEARCPSALTLERLLASELSDDDPVTRHVSACERCQKELEAMRRQGEAYLASPEAKRLRTQLRERELPRRVKPMQRWGASLLLAALSLGAVLLLVSPETPEQARVDLMPKGTAELLLWMDSSEGPVPLTGDSVLDDARIQVGLAPSESGFAAGFLREGKRITRLFPGTAQSLEVGAGAALPHGPSFRVDAETRELTVLVYVSPEPFDVEALEASLGRASDPDFRGSVLERKVRVRER